MTRRIRPPVIRASTAAVVLLALLVSISATWSRSGSAAEPAAATPLRGAGSWGPYREVLTWQNELADGKRSPINLNYIPHGTFLGRQDLIEGDVDFVLSAVPFSPAESAKVPGGGGVIGAPVQVSSMAAILQRPVPDGFLSLDLLCDPDDPDTPDPGACIIRTPYAAAVRVPNLNLAAMLMRYPGGTVPPLSSWNHSAVLKAMDVGNFTTPPLAGPAPVLRSDQDEFNFFLQHYIARAAPSVWAGLKAQDTRIPWEPISERLGRTASASRDGVEQQGQQLALGGGDPGSGTISGFTAGVVAAVPASAIGGVLQSFPDAKVEFLEIQNANGDWVAPTTESISKAIAAGGEQPLHALTNKVAGAYPLAWVVNLYAPAKGLPRDEAEAIATVIRYIATAGQKAAKPVGEGVLSAALTRQALEAANQLVRSNCPGKVVENTDPGPYAPDVPEMQTLGAIAHCTGEPNDPPAAPAPGGTGSFTPGSFSLGAVPTSTDTARAPTGARDADGEGSSDGRRATAALTASKLPLPYPASLGRLDYVATLLLGAGMFLLVRKPVARMLARTRAR